MDISKIKISFFDIDGTLTDDKKVITPTTINTLKKLNENGVKIVICSGRSNTYILNLIKNIDYVDYIISSNGSRIFDIKNNINLYSFNLNVANLEKIWNYSLENKISCILVSENSGFCNLFTDIKSKDNKNAKLIIVNNLKNIDLNNLYQIIIESTNTKKMFELENYLNKFDDLKLINYTHNYLVKDYCFFDIVSHNVNKGVAINELLKNLNINKDEAICFGDSVNDIDMFNSCGIKVAMGNAIDELKQKADYITDTNDNNGISAFFDEYLKSETN